MIINRTTTGNMINTVGATNTNQGEEMTRILNRIITISSSEPTTPGTLTTANSSIR